MSVLKKRKTLLRAFKCLLLEGESVGGNRIANSLLVVFSYTWHCPGIVVRIILEGIIDCFGVFTCKLYRCVPPA